jgi:triphosphoribosyl-dephospho-CoA synthase
MTPEEIATAVQLACLLEASAPKPGNVSPGRHFPDMGYEDFLASAAAIGPAFAADLPLGTTIHAAVRATGQWTRANTNLGIVLLLAPLARAARSMRPLRDALWDVLARTTVEDAREVYTAVRLAQPGGLGTVPEADVTSEPSIPLTDAMRLAAGRDTIAAEYATGFPVTFETGLPAVRAARARGRSWEDTTVDLYLEILSTVPDTLIRRKHGPNVATRISEDARAAARAGPEGRARFDQALRSAQLNPGTTADLTAAALFVAILSGLWK